MGSWWRSADMTYVSLILSEEAAPTCIRELGVLGCLQFIDLNPELTPFQRRYVAYIKRCDEIERKIRYVAGVFMHSTPGVVFVRCLTQLLCYGFIGEIKAMGIPIQPAGTVESFVEKTVEGDASSGAYVLEKLEADLDKHEQQLVELNR
jgi:V-type H+-transporting ATPase subunit a